MAFREGPTLLFIGDSLTEQFDWQRRFSSYRVINAGKAAETIDGLEERLAFLIGAKYRPDIVFIMTGVNDIAMEEPNILPLYTKILAALKKAYPSARFAIQSILPTRLSWIDKNMIVKVNKELKQLSDRAGMIYLDIHSAFLDTKGEPFTSFFQEDGVHLTKDGYEAWARIVEDYLNYWPSNNSAAKRFR